MANIRNSKNERGNVIFLILIVTVLFAALSFAVSDSMRTGNPNAISDEKAKNIVNEAIDYTRNVRQAVQAMRINGCDETQISFEKAPFDGTDTGYVNGAAPGGFSCHLFHPSGGGITHIPPQNDMLSKTKTAEALYGEWYFSGNDSILDIGTASPDLIMFLPWVNDQICERINTTLSVGNSTKEDTDFETTFKFTGSYGTAGMDIGTDGEDLIRTSTGCLEDDNNDYFFYQVLVSR